MRVDSTAISAISYEHTRTTLVVRFASGAQYAYGLVPARVHRAFLAAESKGRFFQVHIRDRYPHQRLS